jgi:hypothetical protein
MKIIIPLPKFIFLSILFIYIILILSLQPFFISMYTLRSLRILPIKKYKWTHIHHHLSISIACMHSTPFPKFSLILEPHCLPIIFYLDLSIFLQHHSWLVFYHIVCPTSSSLWFHGIIIRTHKGLPSSQYSWHPCLYPL